MPAKARNEKSEIPKIRILIVDDHEVFRAGLRSLLHLENDLLIVGEARTLADAQLKIQRQSPDLVLLDVRLPDGSGSEACSRFLARTPQLRILMLTIYAEEDKVVTALKNGAKGYILKDARAEELTRAIRLVAGGQAYLDPEITRLMIGWIKTRQLPTGSNQANAQLSPLEWMIMPLLAEGKTNKEIGAHLKLSDKTIKNNIAQIFSKLGLKRRTEAVVLYLKQSHPKGTLPDGGAHTLEGL